VIPIPALAGPLGARRWQKTRFPQLVRELQAHVLFYASGSLLPPQQVRQEMLDAHIYVLPSTYEEGCGVVVNEAMAAGCCVVARLGAG
jgi:glycosyltransferase involved in cell wall biosynthesis